MSTSNVAPFGTLICDDYGSRCDCCGRLVRRTKRSLWHRGHAICFACFSLWYDGGPEYNSTEVIRARVLLTEGTNAFPFPCDAVRLPE